MSFRSLPLPTSLSGQLWLSAMPGRLEPYPSFLDEARQRQLNLVTCLNPLEEVAQLSPAYYKAITEGRMPFRWQHLPMRDFGVAQDPEQFRVGVEALVQSLTLGENVLLHCAAGIGRTGTVAACALKVMGLSTDAALTRVHAAGSNAQSAIQTGWIERF